MNDTVKKAIAFFKKALQAIATFILGEPVKEAHETDPYGALVPPARTTTTWQKMLAVSARLTELDTLRVELGRQDSLRRAHLNTLTGPDYEFEGIGVQAEMLAISSELEKIYVERELLNHPWFLEQWDSGAFGDDLAAAVVENGSLCPDISVKFVKAYSA